MGQCLRKALDAGGECQLLCRFLGRLDDGSIHTLRRQASEKRQGTKSREVGRRRCNRLYGDLTVAVRIVAVGRRGWSGCWALAGGVCGTGEGLEWRSSDDLAGSVVRGSVASNQAAPLPVRIE